MPNIFEPIPAQSFEIIRDRILEILLDEITNQQEITYDSTSINFCQERQGPNFNYTELPLINVCLANGDYPSKNTTNANGIYYYTIDCHTKANASDEYENADTLAALNMQRLLGKCRAIMANPYYNTLAFAKGFIARVACVSISISEPTKGDMYSTAMGRLTVSVEANEVSELITPENIAGYQTRITIDSSTKGYKYTSD